MKLKPKLIWVSHMIPYPPKAGLLNRSYNIIRELAREYEIHLYCLNQENLITPYFESYEEGIEEAYSELSTICRKVYMHTPSVKVNKYTKLVNVITGMAIGMPYSSRWLFSRTFRNRILKAVEDIQPDILHLDSICLYENIPSNLIGVKVRVLGHHNIESEMMLRRSQKETSFLMKYIYKNEGRLLKKLEKDGLKKFNLNVVCSAEDGENLRKGTKLDTTEVSIVPNGFDLELLEEFERTPRKIRLLFIGTMDWYPNVDAIRHFYKDIWPALRQSFESVEVDIIGANPPSDIVNITALDNKFRVHGFVDDISDYLKSAYVYICPIRDGGGTKLKLIEAFAYGIPCISNPIACEGIAVENGKHVMFASSVEEYIVALKELVNNSELYDCLSKHSYELVESEYSYRKIVEKYVQSIRGIS